MTRTRTVVVIGAGIGGLTAALRLAAEGLEVVVCERADAPGGKMREIVVDGLPIDSGPTVLTMRHVFDEIFAAAGASFDEAVGLTPLDVLARHAWSGGARLDLFSDLSRTRDAVAAFAGPGEARGFVQFAERARGIYETLDRSFMRDVRPSLPDLIRRIGPHRLGALAGIAPFTTLARALEGHFRDPRLRQLFGRYATYCGSSPYLAPATLMLIAHAEREGVWAVEGGMQRVADALATLAERHGTAFRYGSEVAEILVSGGAARGVRLRDGDVVEADAVVANADCAALAGGLFGPAAARAVPATRRADRSLSALTFSLRAEADGFPLAHHTVFFSDDYPAEFDAIRRGRLPEDPTVYVCAPDRGPAEAASSPEERLFLITNAPANGDREAFGPSETELCGTRTLGRLERCGLHVRRRPGSTVATTPSDFARLFPGTGGALYGPASHGWMASFRRPGSRSLLPGLYLAGGSVHPGPGIPMAATSGVLAAASLVSDLASTATSRRAATRGGTSTR